MEEIRSQKRKPADATPSGTESRAYRPRPQAKPSDEPCILCGGRQVAHHCKLVCQDCGAVRDCSDP